MQEYSLNKEQFSDLVQYRKNYENYYGDRSGEIKSYKRCLHLLKRLDIIRLQW